jgi:hypothetical protein
MFIPPRTNHNTGNVAQVRGIPNSLITSSIASIFHVNSKVTNTAVFKAGDILAFCCSLEPDWATGLMAVSYVHQQLDILDKFSVQFKEHEQLAMRSPLTRRRQKWVHLMIQSARGLNRLIRAAPAASTPVPLSMIPAYRQNSEGQSDGSAVNAL